MKRAQEWFSEWFGTSYYVLLYGERNNAEARPLANALIEKLGLKAETRIWDMACGRGRHLFWFAEAGLECYGSDLSVTSIAEATMNVERATLAVHDMRKGPAFEEMDVCVNLFTSLGYFDAEEDDRLVLRSAVNSLKANGTFVLDYLNADTVLKNLVEHDESILNDVHFTVDRWLENGFIKKRIVVKDGTEQHEFQEQVRAYSPSELESMLSDADLDVKEIHGCDMNEPLQGSSRCVIIAKKKG